MATYIKLKKLAGKENAHMIKILRYIAETEGYMSCGNVHFRRLYYEVLREKFISTSQNSYFQGRAVTISIRQYRRLRQYIRGKFSINTAVYLMALYDIMLSYQKKTGIVPCIDNITYTQYIVKSAVNISVTPSFTCVPNSELCSTEYPTLIPIDLLKLIS